MGETIKRSDDAGYDRTKPNRDRVQLKSAVTLFPQGAVVTE